MPLFKYKAKDKKGNDLSGRIEALNMDVAAKILNEKDLIVISIKQASRFKLLERFLHAFDTIPLKDLLFFLRQLSVLISADISLVKSLRIIEKQISNKALRAVVLEIADDVEGGARLSDSLERHPKIFNSFYVNIIRSGETSGKLDEVLNYLADEQEKDYDMLKKVRGAMIYPAFIFSGLIIVGIVMMVYVVPKLASVLEESNVQLPLSTRILIGTSHFFLHYWWLLLLGLGALVFLFGVLIKTKTGKKYWDNFKLRLPLVGPLLQKIYLVRFVRSFSTLISGGVSVVNSLEIVIHIIDNTHYQELFQRAIKGVQDGRPIAEEFFQDKFIPPMFSQMLAIGEETGRITFVLGKISDFYSREIQNVMKNLMTIMEPFIMVVMGVAVGIMVAAIILPMYNLASAV